MKPKKNEEASIYMDSAIIAGVVFLTSLISKQMMDVR